MDDGLSANASPLNIIFIKVGDHFSFWGSWAELLWDMKVRCIEAGGGSGNGTNDDPEKWWVGEVRRAEGEEH